jgi:hypothetical protein
LWLDFITAADQTFGKHLTNTGQRSDSPPTLADDKEESRLLLGWVGTDGGNNLAVVSLVAQNSTPLVGSRVVNGVLTVTGNRIRGTDDTIALDGNSSGGLRVTVNGVATDYGLAKLSQIVIDTGTGTNTIAVHAVDHNIPVTINALGHTTVSVGDNGSMRTVQGTVSIWGAYHSFDLTLDSHADRGAVTQLDSQNGIEAVTGMPQRSTIQFGKSDLGSFAVKTFGFAGSEVDVWDTPDTPVPTDLDLFWRKNQVSIYGTTGALNVNGQGGQDTVSGVPGRPGPGGPRRVAEHHPRHRERLQLHRLDRLDRQRLQRSGRPP